MRAALPWTLVLAACLASAAELAADLAEGQDAGMDVGVSHAGVDSRDEFFKLVGRNQLTSRADNVGRHQHSVDHPRIASRTGRRSSRPRVHRGPAKPDADAATDAVLPEVDVSLRDLALKAVVFEFVEDRASTAVDLGSELAASGARNGGDLLVAVQARA
jgi:hypothetical protein